MNSKQKILLVEPDYRSKFPPLGLMKISSYHKKRKDTVIFVRGCDFESKNQNWDRIYISSLFTWELPRTVKTIKYYSSSVSNKKDIFVGGVGVTLLPDYVRKNVDCTIIIGQIDKTNMLGKGTPQIAKMAPDYSLLDTVGYEYFPRDAYFTRITKGCIRSCKFCAVPILEEEFGMLMGLKQQIREVDKKYGEKQNLIVMDNNILGISGIDNIIEEIAGVGFEVGANRNGRLRYVDFNQGLDARLISENPNLAKLLSKINISPIRLAFDFIGMEKKYKDAISILTTQGFSNFTNYMLFNFKDEPEDLYKRFMINAELNEDLKIRITGFPMRFIPMDDVRRNHISKKWRWRYLRGMQCVLLATRGLVSPNTKFLHFAFGETFEKFLEILSMPDRYIIYRNQYKNNGASDWKSKFKKLSISQREIFFSILDDLNRDYRTRKKKILKMKCYRDLIEHYYPGGNTPPKTPKDDVLQQQGVSVGYDSGPG